MSRCEINHFIICAPGCRIICARHSLTNASLVDLNKKAAKPASKIKEYVEGLGR
jgi:hypothetical protein